MQKFKQISITALVILSLLLFVTTISLAQNVRNNTTNLKTSNSVNSQYTGNKGLDDTPTILNTDSCIPAAGSLDEVFDNHVVIGDSNGSSITILGRAYGGYTRGDGNVYENDVTVSNATVSIAVFGGYNAQSSSSANVIKNSVIINSDGIVSSQAVGGYSNGLGSVAENIITVDGTVTGYVVGGRIENSNNTKAVNNNEVFISGSATTGAYGGLTTGLGEVVGNKVTVSGTIGYNIWGGNIGQASSQATASHNIVTIESTANVKGIYGAYTAGSGIVSMNKVFINGIADVPGGSTYIFGGQSAGGAATYNEVNISGRVGSSTSMAYVYGGNTSAEASNNSINIYAGATVTGNVLGAQTTNGKVSDNKVEISGTVVSIDNNNPTETSNVYGGRSRGGLVTNNAVIVNSGGVVHNITGGGSVGIGEVLGNKVTIFANATATGSVYGGYGSDTSSGKISDNIVVFDGNADTVVHGGYTLGTGAVTGNSVTINGTVNLLVFGGQINMTGNLNVVSNNNVIIAGTVGALSGQGNVYGGVTNGLGDVHNNTVTISGTVNNEVYGGFTSGTGAVTNNSVTIESTAILTTSTSLWGSNIPSVVGNGNTLNVDGFSGNIDTMGNFEYYNFVLGKLDSNNSFITINGAPVDIDYTNINISFSSAFKNNTLSVGDTITVISSITNSDPSSCSITIDTQSPFVTYTFTEVRNTALELIVTGMNPKNETSFVGEGFAAGLAFLGQAADVRSSINVAPQGLRFVPFAKMVYGKQYISTGSSVSVKGFSAIAGLALNTNFDNGSQLVVGAFVEGGWGDYDSRNSFKNSATIKGSGDTEYYGGGVLARYALKTGLYSEGSFAAGKTETDFRTYDFTPGTRSKYDYSVPYYSAHLGVGQVLNLTDMFNLDIYGKYLWTHQAGDNVTLDGYRFKFKDADSHRLRVGGKLQADVSPKLQPYVGAAYEYEFSGRIKGSLNGMNLDKPSLRGGTGIGELGLVWSPSESGSFKVDLGAQGYVGKREGISGGLTVSLSF